MRSHLFAAACLVCLAAGLRAQSSGTGDTARKALEETGRVLKEAQANANTEVTRQNADRVADGGRLTELANEAQAKVTRGPDPDAPRLAAEVDRKLAPTLKNASPEAKVILAQNNSPILRAPDPDAPAGARPAAPVAPTASANPPAAAAAGKPKGKSDADEAKPIDIRSEGAVYLDQAQALAIFTDDVVVDHPQFHLTCDKLEVYFLKKEEKAAADAKGAKSGGDGDDANLKQAIAMGKRVVINKLDEKGEPQIAICRHATYMGDTQDIILRQMPQVQRGNNVILARDPSTYMVLKQNGELKVHGPADTKIVQKPDSAPKPKAPVAAAADADDNVPTAKKAAPAKSAATGKTGTSTTASKKGNKK